MLSPAAHRLPNAVAAATALIFLAAASAPSLANAAPDDLCPLPDPLPPNFSRKCIRPGGMARPERCWLFYTPPAARTASNAIADHPGVPLVIDMHGVMSCAFYNPAYTGWKERADADGFVVAYPQGIADSEVVDVSCFNAGNCCCFKDNITAEGIDDVYFIKRIMLDNVVWSDVRIHPRRIYLAGHSNGCFMAQRVAAEHSDLVAAVCCHAGVNIAYGTAKDFPVGYGGSTSVLTIHGDADDVVLYNGTDNNGLIFPGAEENAALWAKVNNCTDGPIVTEDVGGKFATHTYSGCGTDKTAEVKLIQMYGVGHSPYKAVDGSFALPSNFQTDVDTTKLAQDFCFQHLLSPSASYTTQTPTDTPTQTPQSDAMPVFCSAFENVLMVFAATLFLL